MTILITLFVLAVARCISMRNALTSGIADTWEAYMEI